MAGFDVGDVILKKYAVTRVLGRGGMGIVVAARHQAFDQLVAIKFLQPHVRQSEANCERFVREARTAYLIKSDHVVQMLDVVRDEEGTPFIVMEYLSGQDLAAEIRQRGPLPVEKAVDLLLQACEAIAEAHHLGFVHRDLKPANLFVTTGADGMPCIKVLDFGISKSLADGDASVTSSQAVMGTPLYMSPEQLAASKSIDPRTDVWALGVILYEMLTGKTPFSGESLPVISAAVYRGTYPRFSVERPEVPAALDEVVADALTRSLENRIQSVAAFAARIAPFGTDAARVSLQRIERVAARVGTPVTVAPGIAPTGEPPLSTGGGASVAISVAKDPSRSGNEGQTGPARPRRTSSLVASALIALAAIGVLLGAKKLAVTGDASAPVCPVTDLDKGKPCPECRDKSCCAEHQACDKSRDCGQYYDCLKKCDHGSSCRDTCMRQHPEGHAVAAPLQACTMMSCYGACTSPAADTKCAECQQVHCQSDTAGCFGDPGCDALFACVNACTGQAKYGECTQKCQSEQSPAAVSKFNQFRACGFTFCLDECHPPGR